MTDAGWCPKCGGNGRPGRSRQVVAHCANPTCSWVICRKHGSMHGVEAEQRG